MIIITSKSSDYLLDLLEEMGGNLTDLDLYAVDELDMKAIAMISIYCKKLGGKQYTEVLELKFMVRKTWIQSMWFCSNCT